jgi:diguanylate cyclase (GGDEF)-like protein
MDKVLKSLIELTYELQKPMDLDHLLELIVNHATQLTDCKRASIRMLDPSGIKLMAICRAGKPVHMNPNEQFKLGEGLMGWVVEHQKPINTGDAEADPRFQPRASKANKIGSLAGIPIVSVNACLGVISVVNETPDYFTDLHIKLLTLLAGICAPQIEIKRLSRLATVDPLTGALNRRGLDCNYPISDIIIEESALTPLSMVMIDIDFFKKVNDQYGHLVGDQVLRKITDILSLIIRKGDAVVRYGGEEFLLVIPGVGINIAATIAERARKKVESAVFTFGDTKFRVTISAGVAQNRRNETKDELIERADKAMYRAKESGRNKVELSIVE